MCRHWHPTTRWYRNRTRCSMNTSYHTPHTWVTLSSLRPPHRPKESKIYNSRYSHVVTHRSTNLPIGGFSTGERTGPSFSLHLWSYVLVKIILGNMYLKSKAPEQNREVPPLPIRLGDPILQCMFRAVMRVEYCSTMLSMSSCGRLQTVSSLLSSTIRKVIAYCGPKALYTAACTLLRFCSAWRSG